MFTQHQEEGGNAKNLLRQSYQLTREGHLVKLKKKKYNLMKTCYISDS